jgi:hypothetical protein
VPEAWHASVCRRLEEPDGPSRTSSTAFRFIALAGLGGSARAKRLDRADAAAVADLQLSLSSKFFPAFFVGAPWWCVEFRQASAPSGSPKSQGWPALSLP